MEKYCVHFKDSGKIGNSGQPIFTCEPRELVLGEDAKICFVCDQYKSGKRDYEIEVREDIVDWLEGRRKRQGVGYPKKKTSSRKSRRSRKSEDDDEEEEEDSDSDSDSDSESLDDEPEEAEEEAEEGEEEAEEGEAEEGEEEAEEGEEESEDGHKPKKRPEPKSKKPAPKGKSPAKKVAPAPKGKPVPKKAAPADVTLEPEESELLALIKSKGDSGITQLALKDESPLEANKISKILLTLKDAGLITKEKVKVTDEKTGRATNTNLVKAA